MPNKGTRAAKRELALRMIEDRKAGLSYNQIAHKYSHGTHATKRRDSACSTVRQLCLAHCGPDKSVLDRKLKYHPKGYYSRSNINARRAAKRERIAEISAP